MNKQTSITQPTELERLSNSCLSFRLKNIFISDNNYLFVAPNVRFCRSCFQRRYLTQMMTEVKTVHLHASVLNLAIQIQQQAVDNNSWQAYSIADKKLALSFKLIPYEDCPSCEKHEPSSRTTVKTEYERLLTDKSEADLEGLKKQIFSFGFARTSTITKQIGLPTSEYDGLYGGHHEAKILFRMIAPDGRHADDTALGFDADEELAELKSMMEYLERYAFMMQLCRFKTQNFDDKIITSMLTLYRKSASTNERKLIRGHATWGINLSSREVQAIPLTFLFNKGEIRFLKPTSSGFGAHVDFKKSLCSSILELIERDAFVQFWHDPQRAYHFEASSEIQSEINEIINIIKTAIKNETLLSRFFVIKSPTSIPVVLITISSEDFTQAPSLCFGCGVGFNLDEAINGAIEELRQNTANLVKGITVIDGFLTRRFTHKIEALPDRMNYYATSVPRAKLKFLDNKNPLIDDIFESIKRHDLDALIKRFEQADCEIYGIDCTPRCFSDKNVFVTRAYSPQLYPMQFEQERAFKIQTSPLSVHKELPHFFL